MFARARRCAPPRTREVTETFVTLGWITTACQVCTIVTLALYLSLPEVRRSHSYAEVITLFTVVALGFYGIIVREPIWAARDCRQAFLENSIVEQICLHYRTAPLIFPKQESGMRLCTKLIFSSLAWQAIASRSQCLKL